MTHNLKTFGLAFVAIMAMSAVAAGSVSAAFESESAPVTVTPRVESSQRFQYDEEGIAISCSSLSGDGTVSASHVIEATVGLSDMTCSTAIGPAHVKFNGCDFKYTSATNLTSMSVHVECPTGKSIEITVTDAFASDLCTIHLRAQTPGGTISGSNIGVGTTREVTIHHAVTGIVGERTGSPVCGPPSSSHGTYEGDVIVTGESSTVGTHVGVYMD